MKSLLILVFTIISLVSFSQEKGTKSLELYYPNYYFYESFKFHLVPLKQPNVGITYSSFNFEKEKGFHISADLYQHIGNYWSRKSLDSPGIINRRQIISLSFGRDKLLLEKKKISINWFGEGNFRTGYENWWTGTFGAELLFQKRFMLDFGASIGSKITIKLPSNFSLSLEGKQSLYFFRWYNVFEIFDNTTSWDKGTPLTSLNVNFKLGYSLNSK
ncbi:hypothetical protein DNU06_09165 [Putridiphycobacter roseus]|uniref:Uncharacterized protein n=1 Tax=Putridiphycobacter roseus TaxID=2219161 RepID=A0A2W1N1J4_9FLAO|nr:hypothetical protein [Putridiphycobacter roseus]PZE17430.1 hypothetical protein DNU06_09165 [Putridiphycobacter roseus]